MKMEEREWVLDVTLGTPVFIPYEKNTDTYVTGLNVLAERCPGKLVGIVHFDGQEYLDLWLEKNPNAFEKFCSENQLDSR